MANKNAAIVIDEGGKLLDTIYADVSRDDESRV